MRVERSLARMPTEVFSEKCLASFVNCLIKRKCEDEVHLFEVDVRVASMKSRVKSEGFVLAYMTTLGP